MAQEIDLRRRVLRKASPPPVSKVPTTTTPSHAQFSALDVLRMLGGLILVSCALSWYVTNESIMWGWRPSFSKYGVVKQWLKGPISLTDQELGQFDGTNPKLPIYVAVNGSIFDVSASRHTYGPGGSYHFFAGKDATRAFVTGCFQEDLTPDLRGVDEMYMPRASEDSSSADADDLDVDGKKLTKQQVKIRREQERLFARKKVAEGVKHWEDFFGNSDKYFFVGKVKRETGWLEKIPQRELCESAKNSRPIRKKGIEVVL
ncbi:MAG: hypothetical protein M1829_000618 [Trizodia sp. TS-e1964]|nr:MAG: hypothetical protein M1829_000618 [Trizodia sp. TS-e1964]